MRSEIGSEEFHLYKLENRLNFWRAETEIRVKNKSLLLKMRWVKIQGN